MSIIPCLETWLLKTLGLVALVNKSATWPVEEIGSNRIRPVWACSLHGSQYQYPSFVHERQDLL